MEIANLLSVLLVPIALSSAAQQTCYSPSADANSKVPFPMSRFTDNLPNEVVWFPAVDKPGVSCVGACADSRFKYAALNHKAGAQVQCHCADPPSGQSPPSGLQANRSSYHLVAVPRIPDNTQYAADHPTTVAVHLGPGLIRYIINGEPQPILFLPAHAPGALEFPADKQGAVGCVGSCWQLGYAAAGLDSTKCVCADLKNTKLVNQYRPNSDQIPAADITKFIKKQEPSGTVSIQMPTVPHSHYVRLSYNFVPAGTWFTPSGTAKPPGKWQDLPESKGFDTCVNQCAQKRKPYAALLWDKDAYKCMCGEADVKSPETPLLNYYPTSPGAWQIVDVTPAHPKKKEEKGPLPTVSVISPRGVQLGKLSAHLEDSGYILFYVQEKGAPKSVPLQSTYVSAMPPGMSWMEQSFPVGGDIRVQCVSACYKLEFSAAAVTTKKCLCVDHKDGQLKPAASPPPERDMIQIVLLPPPPKRKPPPPPSSSSSQRIIGIDISATAMSNHAFRLFINGAKVPVKFASSSAISKANGVSFTPEIFAGQALPMKCVGRCWKLSFELMTVVDNKCKCMDSGAISLSDSNSQDLFTVYDISAFISTARKHTGEGMTINVEEIPETHYIRLILNYAVCRTWYTAPGVKPPGTWQTMPGSLSFGMCVDMCTGRYKPYAAMLWDEGRSYKCMCGTTDVKSESLSEKYLLKPGAWQIVDIGIAVKMNPLPMMQVADFTGQSVWFSGRIISNSYIEFSAKRPEEKSPTVLKSAYSSALPSGMTWLEYAISADSEPRVGCVADCFRMMFAVAAINPDSRCFCADVKAGQLKPSATPPSAGGMVQAVLLPRPLAIQKSEHTDLVFGEIMTPTLFRLIMNGAPLRPQFAHPDKVSKASVSSGVTFPAGSSWRGKPDAGNCALHCQSLLFSLVAVAGEDCKCIEKEAISLSSSYADGLTSVYDISATLLKGAGKRAVYTANIPVTNYVRLFIGDNLAPTKFVAPGSLKGWKKKEKIPTPYDCTKACLKDGSKYISIINNPTAFTTACRCSPKDTKAISFPDKITYPSTGGQEQIVDLSVLFS